MKKEINITSIDERYIRYTLENNLRVYVYSNPELSEYYAAFTTYYGSNFDEIPGTAHFLEHSLFTKEDGDIFQKFATNNASCNAFTSNHQTTYYFTSSDRFEQNFTLLQRLVNEGHFTETNVKKEMGIIEEEIAMYAQSSDTKIRNTTLKNACIKSKYGVDIAGEAADINQLTPEILKEVHNKYYVPSNQSIVLSGNFENIDVLSLVNQITDRELQKPHVYEDEHVNVNSDVIEIADLNVDMFTHTFKFKTSSDMAENIRDYISLNVFLSTYFSHLNENYNKYKNENIFTTLLEHSVLVTPSIKLLFFEMNYTDNSNLFNEFMDQIKLNENELIGGLIKIKAYEIRQITNKKRLMENVMYSLSDDFEYDEYINILFNVKIEEILERVKKLFTECSESKIIFKGINGKKEV